MSARGPAAPVARRRLGRVILGLASPVALLACADPGTTGPGGEEDSRSIVSEPVRAATLGAGSTASFQAPASLMTSLAADVAYVSAPPGSFPDGVSVTIRNVTTDSRATAALPVLAGGFDPVAVAANPGDQLELRVTNIDGSVAVFAKSVPKRRPPRVVRTDPPRGKTDVAFSITIVIVFSEPIAPATVTPTNIRLERNGQVVPAQLTLDPEGVLVEVTPLTALQPGATYTLRISTGVTDRSGDPVESDEVITFTTAGPIPPLPPSAEISFVSTRGGDTAIYVMNADGSGATRVRTGSRAVWSPDGSKLAVVARGELESDDIYVVNADGSGLARLVRGPDHERDPAWSPDGRRIAFRRDQGQLTNGLFYGYRNGGSAILIVNADGTGQTGSLGGGSYPAWAPDGRRIAFVSMLGVWVERAGTPFVRCERLFVSDVGYTTVVPLTAAGDTTCVTGPAWSPDGGRVVFAMARVRGGGRELNRGFDLFPSDLYAVSPDGGALTALTTSSGDEFAPAWSPDGSRLAFTSNRDGRSQIYVMNSDGSDARNISASAYEDAHPSWRRRR